MVVAKRFRVLAEPCRLRLPQQLEKGEMTVNELVEALDGNQPNVSKHLALLHDAGLAARRWEGTSVLYCIDDPVVFKLCELVCRSEAEKTKREFEDFRGILKERKRDDDRPC